MCQKIPYLKYLFLIMRIYWLTYYVYFLETVQDFFVRLGYKTTYASNKQKSSCLMFSTDQPKLSSTSSKTAKFWFIFQCWNQPNPSFFQTKGQLISKGHFGVFNSSKKRTSNSNLYPSLMGQRFFVICLEE